MYHLDCERSAEAHSVRSRGFRGLVAAAVNVAAAFQHQFDIFQAPRLLAMVRDRSKPFLVGVLGLDGGVIVGLSKMVFVGF